MPDNLDKYKEIWGRIPGVEITPEHIKALNWLLNANEMIMSQHRSRFHRIPNLYIWGPTGTGKSTLLWMLYNTMKRHLDIPVIAREQTGYWNMREIIQETKDSWQTDGKFLRVNCQKKAVMLLDDVGAERYTDFTVDMVDEIFNYRELSGWPTIVTSNLNPGALRVRYGSERFNSRFFGSCDEIHMDGKDRRRQG